MNIPPRWFVESITVETYQGSGAYGDEYAAPVIVLGHVSGGRRVTQTSQGYDVLPSEHVLLPNPARLADGTGVVDPSLTLVAQSRVTSGNLTGYVSEVVEHRQPGAGNVVYVSGEIAL